MYKFQYRIDRAVCPERSERKIIFVLHGKQNDRACLRFYVGRGKNRRYVSLAARRVSAGIHIARKEKYSRRFRGRGSNCRLETASVHPGNSGVGFGMKFQKRNLSSARARAAPAVADESLDLLSRLILRHITGGGGGGGTAERYLCKRRRQVARNFLTLSANSFSPAFSARVGEGSEGDITVQSEIAATGAGLCLANRYSSVQHSRHAVSRIRISPSAFKSRIPT